MNTVGKISFLKSICEVIIVGFKLTLFGKFRKKKKIYYSLIAVRPLR